MEDITSRYTTLFASCYGHLKQVKASIKLQDHAQPIFLKARPVPYALKDKVEQELQRLEDEGIIYKVNQSEWAAPVVLVPKKDGSLRVCGDYKTTVNQCADVDQYPLPNAKDLFATLAGGRVFSKIDLSHAYQQVELDEKSQKYLTINTHKGLYRYKRLPFGAWQWTEECESAFRRSKEQLQASPLLVDYDLKKPLRLACDASSYGVGAVISHVIENGEERPIAFASRTLSASERNYSQTEKEALSIVFGVKTFHSYLYRRKFTLITDHKPLVTLLGPKTGVPTLAAARMHRWSLILAAYQYEIEYRKSAEHANADAMSRLVPLTAEEESETEGYVVSYVDELPITAGDIAAATRKDPVLAPVYDFSLHGWPQAVEDPLLQPYFSRREELSVDQSCVLWGLRAVIPGMYRDRLLDDLHQEHHGIRRMKSQEDIFGGQDWMQT